MTRRKSTSAGLNMVNNNSPLTKPSCNACTEHKRCMENARCTCRNREKVIGWRDTSFSQKAKYNKAPGM